MTEQRCVKKRSLPGMETFGTIGDYLVEQERVNDSRARRDLSLVARLGGHSAPCTHRGRDRCPVVTITYALIQMFENVGDSCSMWCFTTIANSFTGRSWGICGCIELAITIKATLGES